MVQLMGGDGVQDNDVDDNEDDMAALFNLNTIMWID